jgi:hypothetical protein
MPEILFLHKGRHAASTRYRALQYFDCLSEAGWNPHEMQVSGSVSQYRRALQAAARADVVVVLKKPFKSLFRYLLRRASRRLIFDFDDAVYVRDSGADSPRRFKQFKIMVAQCDDVWAGNDELLLLAAEYSRNHCLIPTSLANAKYALEIGKQSSPIELVWIGGRASRPWLESIMPTLEHAARQLPGLRLKIVADFTLQAHDLEVVEVPWSEETEARALVESHIGIAPLPDSAFTRGKCGLKTLQYMAAGLPVIATPTSVQSNMVIEGENGYLADSEQAWLSALSALAVDPELRDRMGRCGRQMCADNYSLATTCHKIIERLAAIC